MSTPAEPTDQGTSTPTGGGEQLAEGTAPTMGGSTNPAANAKQAPDPLEKFDPFKWLEIEYQKATERYENIYKSYWQSFAYLFVISGAILTFGGTHLNLIWTLFFACIPLLFWYYASCVPLDRYAAQVEERLAVIEGTVSTFVASKQIVASSGLLGSWPGMFTKFKESRRSEEGLIRIACEMLLALVQFQRSDRPRVRNTMDVAFLLVRGLALVLLIAGVVGFISALLFPPQKTSANPIPTLTIDVGKNLGDVLKDALNRPQQPPSAPQTSKSLP